MASARAVMDLNAEHGTSELKEGMRFSSGTDATYFMQDYTYNANTRCCVKSSGTMKKYTCSHDKKAKTKGVVSNDKGETTSISSVDDRSIPGDVCGWEVRVAIKRERDGSQLFWVSYINDLHSDLCTSTAKATKRQLTKLATLRTAVLGDRKVKGKALVAMLQSRDGVSMQFSRSTLYRAKDAIIDSADGNWEESFRRLPFMLAGISDLNPGTLVQLEVDQHQRFLRGFIALGANVQCQAGLLPLLGFDGAHSKHSKYNGVVLSLLGRDGNNKNITLATALVNVENEANNLWFLEQCHCTGIQLSGRATFCDRGKIVGAAPKFFLRTGILVNLRYCTLHIIRNLHKKIKKSGQAFDNAVWAIQGADTHKKYAEALDKMETAFGVDVVEYLKEIGPTAWAVHANMSTYIPSVVEDNGNGADMHGDIGDNHSGARLDAAACASCDGGGDSCHLASSHGVLSSSIETSSADADFSEAECECRQFAETHAVPMFQWRTSNFVESDNNALIENGVRDSDPCSAFYKITVEAMKKLSVCRDALEKWQKAGSDLTPYAKKLWSKEKERVGKYMVELPLSSLNCAALPLSSLSCAAESLP